MVEVVGRQGGDDDLSNGDVAGRRLEGRHRFGAAWQRLAADEVERPPAVRPVGGPS
jgi:hypothetical protein